MTRLNSARLGELIGVHLPQYDRNKITNGLLHIGTGNFHRAHQAVYADDILKEDSRWGILGASLRSSIIRDRLKHQDFLYSVCERNGEDSKYRVVGSISEVLHLAGQRAELMAAFCKPEIKVVTLTVTEKGYCQTVLGELDENHPDIFHDLRNMQAARSMPGVLVSGLQARRAAGAGPLTVVSCDNLSGNGRILRRVVKNFTGLIDPSLSEWCEGNVGFPETMVDRIVPRPTDHDRHEFLQLSGLRDEALLVTEDFRQWVIEDKFLAERPPWEAAGVQIVKDVSLFESVKLRMLNAAHSALAYLGIILGYEYIHEAMQDQPLSMFVDYLLRHEVAPLLNTPTGIDLESYQYEVFKRFRNPAIAYSTSQVATDGSKKLSQRILPSLEMALERGQKTKGLTLVFLAWLKCMTEDSLAVKFSDPAHGITDKSELLAVAGVSSEIAMSVMSRFKEISEDGLRKEILSILADN